MKPVIGHLHYDEKLRTFLMILAANKLSVKVYNGKHWRFQKRCVIEGSPKQWALRIGSGNNGWRIEFNESEINDYDPDITDMVIDFDPEDE